MRYGAIPYELTHPGERCGQVPAETAAHTACRPASRISGGQPATWTTVFTSMFLHGSFLALFFSLLFLVLFGPSVEDALGRGRFLCLYLLGGLVALALRVAVGADSVDPVLGSSGALAAVLGAYLLLHPRAKVVTLVLLPLFATIAEVPALILLALWLPLQVWLALSGLADPIAGSEWVLFATQLGGALVGLGTVWALRGRLHPGPPGNSPSAAVAA